MEVENMFRRKEKVIEIKQVQQPMQVEQPKQTTQQESLDYEAELKLIREKINNLKNVTQQQETKQEEEKSTVELFRYEIETLNLLAGIYAELQEIRKVLNEIKLQQ